MESSTANVIGLDIGGANLKYADSSGRTHCTEFPLWQRPDDLEKRLAVDLRRFAETRVQGIAVVMTGELADCFLDRAEGVQRIARQLDAAAVSLGLPNPRYYAVDGCFHDSAFAETDADQIAAANWHALASYVADRFATDGWLIDIGTTTTDIIPFNGGTVATESRTDFDRLRAKELVYLGGARTPVCSVVSELIVDDHSVPLMREVFATMDDVRILLGFVAEAPKDNQSADGKPRDRFHCANRIARMVGLDHRSIPIEQATQLAAEVHRAARSVLADAFSRIPEAATVVLSGHARDLLSDAIRDRDVIDLEQQLGSELSRVAPAYAAAKLLSSSCSATCDVS
ncbi:MAG: hydantoinase/oxoprolinase family protein [Planctomycetota bacterium]